MSSANILANRTALVTAASKGIGRACAERLASMGADVVICSRDKENIERTALEIEREIGGDIIPLVCDLTDKAHLEQMCSRIINQTNGVDILVLNSGNPPSGSFSQVTTDMWHNGLQLLFWSTLFILRRLLPQMKSQTWGRVVVVSSVFARKSHSGFVVSSSLRALLLSLVSCLVDELARSNVSINTVLAGYTDTALLREAASVEARKSNSSVESVIKEWSSFQPNGKLVTPAEVANLVGFFCSVTGVGVTGAAVSVDNGFLSSSR